MDIIRLQHDVLEIEKFINEFYNSKLHNKNDEDKTDLIMYMDFIKVYNYLMPIMTFLKNFNELVDIYNNSIRIYKEKKSNIILKYAKKNENKEVINDVNGEIEIDENFREMYDNELNELNDKYSTEISIFDLMSRLCDSVNNIKYNSDKLNISYISHVSTDILNILMRYGLI